VSVSTAPVWTEIWGALQVVKRCRSWPLLIGATLALFVPGFASSASTMYYDWVMRDSRFATEEGPVILGLPAHRALVVLVPSFACCRDEAFPARRRVQWFRDQSSVGLCKRSWPVANRTPVACGARCWHHELCEQTGNCAASRSCRIGVSKCICITISPGMTGHCQAFVPRH